MRRGLMSRVVAGLAAAFAAISGGLAVVAWRRTGLPYGEAGTYFDGLVTVDDQSMLAFVVLAAMAAVMALALWVLHRRLRQP